jgi:hypothetical protein
MASMLLFNVQQKERKGKGKREEEVRNYNVHKRSHDKIIARDPYVDIRCFDGARTNFVYVPCITTLGVEYGQSSFTKTKLRPSDRSLPAKLMPTFS